jgi:hypothetical protein
VVPSARLVVPSSEALAPVPALGLPLVSSGGQFWAQAPEQVLLPCLSLAKRYSVWDLPSTTMLPSELVPVLTVAGLLAADEAIAVKPAQSRRGDGSAAGGRTRP